MKKTPLLKIFAAFFVLLLFSTPAHASNKVSSPDITEGQIELEYRGGYDVDALDKRNGQQLHKFVANYGILDRWRMEAKGIVAQNGHGYVGTDVEWSNRVQLLKGKDGGPKLSVQQNYKFALRDQKADRLELTLLASQDTGDFGHVVNMNAEREVGSHSIGGTNLNLGWKSKYRYLPSFEPGVEIYAGFGKFGGPPTKGPKNYMAGPMAYGALGKSLKYDVGFLAGLSDAAPAGRFKWILTYVF